MIDNGDLYHQDRLNEVLLAYIEGAQAGRAPDRRQLIEANPDLRIQLEDFFASHDEIARLMTPLREAQSENGAATLETEAGVKTAAGDSETGMPEIGRLGDFRLLREVGRGGMGIVYEAEQIALRRRVALKVLPFAAAIDPRQLQRFQNEALAAGHLRHENIVPVHAVGNERGVHYYAMQFIEGRSLAALIVELRPQVEESEQSSESSLNQKGQHATTQLVRDPTRVESKPAPADDIVASISRERMAGDRRYFEWLANLGRQAALALEHAHQAGIVHRDIKPANLLLDPRGQLWVADFGLAQFSNNASLTVTGEILGTLRYASPEQALAKRGLIDHRTDIYSLGASLYELLTLQPIFDGRDRQDLLRQIADEEPALPSSIVPALPVELETIILKAIAKEPSERYASAQALADDLQSFRDDRPISARRPAALERASKWARRHKSLVASALAALLLTVAGLSLAIVVVAHAYDRERLRARETEDRFQLARRLADEMIQIAEQETADDPQQQLLRRRMLEVAVAYYQEFIELQRENPGAQANLEVTQTQVKTLLNDLAVMHDAQRHMLLSEPSVQSELALTENQKKRLEMIFQDIMDHGPSQRREAAPSSADQRSQSLLREMKAHETGITEILTAPQLARLHQIALQVRGMQAFQEPEVIAALALGREQREELREICKRSPPPGIRGPEHKPGPRGPDWDRGPPDGHDQGRRSPPGRGSRPDSGSDLRKALAVLTPEQLERWDALTGAPFAVGSGNMKGRRGPPNH